jgi:rhodanese-related sulfurtransferase
MSSDELPQICTAAELARKRQAEEDFLLLDVRADEEYAFAAIHPSLFIPLHELPARLKELEGWEDREIICLCHLGMRSAHAQQFLRQHGFNNVRNLHGGIHAYAIEVDNSIPQYG